MQQQGFRWKHQHTAIAIVFTIWMVSYLDRMVMSTAIPYIAKDFDLSPAAMGAVMSAFFAGYALCQIPGGILSDRFGARKVLVFSILWWSVFTFFTGLAGGLTVLIIVRLMFGIGEGLGPAATWKTIAVWTPAAKRGFANSIMMSTNALGPALAPLVVVAVMAEYGWHTVFYMLGLPGIAVALWVWFKLPDNPADKKGMTREELDEINALPEDQPEKVAQVDMSFVEVAKQPPVWKSFLLMFFNNTAVWGYMAWLPSYLVKARGLDMKAMGYAASAPFFAGFVGAIATGYLIDKGLKNIRARCLAVVELLMAASLYLMFTATDMTSVVIFNTTTGFLSFCIMALIYSLPLTEVPKEIAGRAMGIVNTGGQLAAFLAPLTVGFLVITLPDGTQNFNTAFGYLCFANLVAAVIAFFYSSKKKAAA